MSLEKVSAAVDQGTEANPPIRRAKRMAVADPSRNQAKPNGSGGGRRVVRKVVDDRDDRPREPA